MCTVGYIGLQAASYESVVNLLSSKIFKTLISLRGRDGFGIGMVFTNGKILTVYSDTIKSLIAALPSPETLAQSREFSDLLVEAVLFYGRAAPETEPFEFSLDNAQPLLIPRYLQSDSDFYRYLVVWHGLISKVNGQPLRQFVKQNKAILYPDIDLNNLTDTVVLQSLIENYGLKNACRMIDGKYVILAYDISARKLIIRNNYLSAYNWPAKILQPYIPEYLVKQVLINAPYLKLLF